MVFPLSEEAAGSSREGAHSARAIGATGTTAAKALRASAEAAAATAFSLSSSSQSASSFTAQSANNNNVAAIIASSSPAAAFSPPMYKLFGGGPPDRDAVLRLMAGGGLFFILGLYLLHVLAIAYGRHRLHKAPVKLQRNGFIANGKSNQQQQQREQLTGPAPPADLPGVTILKPVVGTDQNLTENLESFFRLDYPKFELLFCLNSRYDPAFELVQRLSAKYPEIQCRWFVGGQRVGLNPKINNMYPAYVASQYPLVLVSDQGIYMCQEALLDMVLCMLERPDIALVTQPPYCKNRPGLGAALEQVYFGGAHSRIYLASHAIRFVCSTGMSSLMVKEVVEQCGGFKQFSAYLAEDYFLGQAFAKAGYRNVISHMPALQNSANTTVQVFQERICRWIKLRIAMLPHTILLEPAQECVCASVIGALSVAQLAGQQWVPAFLAFHYVYWAGCDFLLLRTMQNGTPLPFTIPYFLGCWLFREFMAFPIFVKAILNPHIGWRFGTYQLCWGGRIRPAKQC